MENYKQHYEKLTEDQLKKMWGCDHDALTYWRMDNRDKCKPYKWDGYLVCPLTGTAFCKTCGWSNGGPCFCDFSYG